MRHQGVRPDVGIVSSCGFELAIEIYVTSAVKEEKAHVLNEFKLPTIEINLNDFYNSNLEKCRFDEQFVKSNLDSLLTDIQLKNWIILPEKDEDVPLNRVMQKKKNGSWAWWLAGLAILVIFGPKIKRKLPRGLQRFLRFLGI